MRYNLGHEHPSSPGKDQSKLLEGDPIGWSSQMFSSVCAWETFLTISQMQFSSMSQVHFGDRSTQCWSPEGIALAFQIVTHWPILMSAGNAVRNWRMETITGPGMSLPTHVSSFWLETLQKICIHLLSSLSSGWCSWPGTRTQFSGFILHAACLQLYTIIRIRKSLVRAQIQIFNLKMWHLSSLLHSKPSHIRIYFRT